ncbi:hypothetical protein ABZP36_033733 [Zizania latifolia]
MEHNLRGWALHASVLGNRPAVAPKMLVASLVSCGVLRCNVRVKTCRSFDFLISFASPDDCTRILSLSRLFRCGGAPVSFRRWSRISAVDGCALRYFIKLSLDGLPAHIQDEVSLRHILNSLHCHLVELLLATDAHGFKVLAWVDMSTNIPKRLDIIVPKQVASTSTMDSDEELYASMEPSPPPPREKWCLSYSVIVHVLEVLDSTPILSFDCRREDDDSLDEETTRRHFFPCFLGRVDGSGPGGDREGSSAFTGAFGAAGGLPRQTVATPPAPSSSLALPALALMVLPLPSVAVLQPLVPEARQLLALDWAVESAPPRIPMHSLST